MLSLSTSDDRTAEQIKMFAIQRKGTARQCDEYSFLPVININHVAAYRDFGWKLVPNSLHFLFPDSWNRKLITAHH